MRKNIYLSAILLFIICGACKNMGGSPNYETLPAITENGNINVVIEIPAGTNHKIEYQKESRTFENDMEDDEIRIINFLPYPGNYGFIPSTYMDPERGGDGDALDVLLIAEHLETGQVMEARPIAALRLSDRGEIDTKIIAIPTAAENKLINADNFIEFMLEYGSAKLIIEEWFLNYKGLGTIELLGWEDENYALGEINKWMLSQN